MIRRILFLAFALAGLTGGAAVAQTTIALPSSQVQLGAEERAAAIRWLANHGIVSDIFYDADDLIAFQYGGRQQRLTEDSFIEFAKARMIGQTIVGVRRTNLTSDTGGVLAQITYFAPDQMAYGWTPGQFGVVPSRITFRRPSRQEKARGFVGGLMCFTPITSRQQFCSSIYDQLIGAHGRHDGDPLGLANLQAPEGLTISSNWPDGQALVPERAPHE